MQRSVYFRRILLLLLVALLLWTVLTAMTYSMLSKPVFTRIKVDELKPKAQTMANIAAASFLQPDPYFDTILNSAFEFFDAWVFVVDGLSGKIRNTSMPEQSNLAELEIQTQINQQTEGILTGEYSSVWFTRRMRGSGGEMLFIGVPVNLRFGSQSNVVGAVFFVKPLEELSLGLRNLNIALFTSSLFVFLLMLYPTYKATARLIQPLRQTRDVALAMGEGDFSVRADTRQKGEIGELATTMNNLAEQLSGSISALTLERNRLRQILEGMGEGLIAVDTSCHITQINQAALSLIGYKNGFSDSENSQPLATLTNGQQTFKEEGLFLDAFIRVLDDQDATQITLTHVSDRRILLHISRLLDSRGRIAGAVGLLRDITESERLEQTRRDYVANVSHELRTPLTAIRALLEPLNDGMVSEEADQRRYYGILLRETARLSNLINDMLELSRLQAKSLPIHMKRMNLDELTADLAIKYQTQMDDLDLKFYISDKASSCPDAYADQERVEQILVILLDNAMKFTPSGGRIDLLLSWDNDLIYLTVADTGMGISPEDIDHVFDRFYKADKAHQQPGTGLGLSIAKEILIQMGQQITVESTPGQGTAFTFTLSRYK